MSNLLRSTLFVLCTLTLGQAHADEYSIRVGRPLTGSSLPSQTVGLGIEVAIDKSWAQLTPAEQLIWRDYTELTDPAVTPPFPLPHIRSFLRKLETPEIFKSTENVIRIDKVLLIVHVTETGEVSKVGIVSGPADEGGKLSKDEARLAAVYVRALVATKFSPALLNGQPVPSAFPMWIARKMLMN